jgi:hypothetical protein
MRRLASFGKAGVERDYGISHNSGGIGEQLRTVRLAATSESRSTRALPPKSRSPELLHESARGVSVPLSPRSVGYDQPDRCSLFQAHRRAPPARRRHDRQRRPTGLGAGGPGRQSHRGLPPPRRSTKAAAIAAARAAALPPPGVAASAAKSMSSARNDWSITDSLIAQTSDPTGEERVPDRPSSGLGPSLPTPPRAGRWTR